MKKLNQLFNKEDIQQVDARPEENDKIKLSANKARIWLSNKFSKFEDYFKQIKAKVSAVRQKVFDRYFTEGQSLFHKAFLQLNQVKEYNDSARKEVLYNFILDFNQRFGGINPDTLENFQKNESSTNKVDVQKQTRYRSNNETVNFKIKELEKTHAPEASIKALIKLGQTAPEAFVFHKKIIDFLIANAKNKTLFTQGVDRIVRIHSRLTAEMNALTSIHLFHLFQIIPLDLQEVSSNNKERTSNRLSIGIALADDNHFSKSESLAAVRLHLFQKRIQKLTNADRPTILKEMTKIAKEIQQKSDIYTNSKAQEILNHIYRKWNSSILPWNKAKTIEVTKQFAQILSERKNHEWLQVPGFYETVKKINAGTPKQISDQLYSLIAKWGNLKVTLETQKYLPVQEKIKKIENQCPGIKLQGPFTWYRGEFTIQKFSERKDKWINKDKLQATLLAELKKQIHAITKSNFGPKITIDELIKIYNKLETTDTPSITKKIKAHKDRLKKQQNQFKAILDEATQITKHFPDGFEWPKPALTISKQILRLTKSTHILPQNKTTKLNTEYRKELLQHLKPSVKELLSSLEWDQIVKRIKPPQTSEKIYNHYESLINNAKDLTELASITKKIVGPKIEHLQIEHKEKPTSHYQHFRRAYRNSLNLITRIRQSAWQKRFLKSIKGKTSYTASIKNFFKTSSDALQTSLATLTKNNLSPRQARATLYQAQKTLYNFAIRYTIIRFRKNPDTQTALLASIKNKENSSNPSYLNRILRTLLNNRKINRLTHAITRAKKSKGKLDISKHLAKAPTESDRRYAKLTKAYSKTLQVLDMDQNTKQKRKLKTTFYQLSRHDYINKRIHEQYPNPKPGQDIIRVYDRHGRLISVAVAMKIQHPRHGDPQKDGVTYVNIWGYRKGQRMWLLPNRFYSHSTKPQPDNQLLAQATNARRAYIDRVTGGSRRRPPRIARRNTPKSRTRLAHHKPTT